MEGLVRSIGIISRNNNALASMVAQMSADASTDIEPRDLSMLLQDTGQLARETGQRLVSLQRTDALPARQRTMHGKLNKDFQFVLRRFQQLAQQASQNARRRQQDRRHGGGASTSELQADEPVYDERQGLMEAERVQQEVQEQLQRERVARANMESMAERERMIKQVETTVGEVNEIFVDLAGLVQEQGTHIDHISTAIEKTSHETTRANVELRSASNYKSKMRSRTCCLYLAVVLGGFIVLLMMMWRSS